MTTYNSVDKFVQEAERVNEVCLHIQLNKPNGMREDTVEGTASLFREGVVNVTPHSQDNKTYAVHGEKSSEPSGRIRLFNESGSFDIGCFESVEIED